MPHRVRVVLVHVPPLTGVAGTTFYLLFGVKSSVSTESNAVLSQGFVNFVVLDIGGALTEPYLTR